MKNIEEKILMAEEEIKQLQNKIKKLISQQKEEERKKRDRRLYEKGGVFESIFTESKELTKDEFYQLISSLNHKEEIRQKIKKIIAKREENKNQNIETQEEVSGIHDSFDAIPISKNYILQMHKIMFSHMNNPIAGQTKNIQNYISATYPDGHTEVLFTPLSPFETPETLYKICNEYNKVIGNLELEPLIAIPIFIHDFLCIHPFNDGNGRMSRLLTTLLLYRSGFYVGKYISLEALIAKNKSAYYDALGQAGVHWHEENDDVLPFLKYILGTILSAYKEFEDRFSIVEEKLPAVELVRKATFQKLGRFTKQDIRELCPSLSVSSIEGALRKLIAEGEIKREGVGRATKYIRLK